MMKLKLTGAILLCIIISAKTIAQSNNTFSEPTNVATAIPPSPDAAAIGKYGDVPVGYYTGIPSISVPLYDIKSQDISVPLSLNYFAGGVKVEEVASSVGLGWSLNAGGVITRTVQGLPDEGTNGYLNGKHYIDTLVNYGSNNRQYNLYNTWIANGTIDGQPDIFCYNFCGYSGKFVFDQSGVPHVIPSAQLKISYATNGYYITSFSVITPDGMQYAFNSYELTKTYNSCTTNGTYTQTTTAWFLTSITNPGNTQTVNFQYQQNSFSNTTLKSTTLYALYQVIDPQSTGMVPSNPPPSYNPQCTNGNNCWSQKLTEIDFANGKVYFYTDSARKDFVNVPQYTRIAIQSNDLKFKKQYRLFYSYFGNNARLRLDSLEEVINDPSYADTVHFLPINSYKFTYNNNVTIPSTTSCAQDTWGFYNGETNNDNIPTLAPAMLFTPAGSSYTVELAGAKREVNTSYCQMAILQSITYPTGGTTSFNYESNTEGNYNTLNFIQVPEQAMANDDNNGYFDVVTDSSKIHIYSQGSGLYQNVLGNTDFITGEVYIVGSKGQDSLGLFPIWNGDSSYLISPGYYHLVKSNPKNQNYTTIIQLNWENDDTTSVSNNYLAGGLRIKTITDYDPIAGNTSVRNFAYTIGTSSTSSGAVVDIPNYSYNWQYMTKTAGGIEYGATYFVRTGISNYPLVASQGAPVGYSQVTVTYDNNGQNGKTEYYYQNAENGDQDVIWGNFPFAPNESHEWRRGNLIEQIDYSYNGSSYIKLKDHVNTYTGVGFTGVAGVTCAFSPTPVDNIAYDTITSEPQIIFHVPYEWWQLQSDTTRIYSNDGSGNYVQTWDTYQYDNTSYLPSQITSNNSKGQLVNTYMTYPGDYTSRFTAGIAELNTYHILTPVIEKYQTISNSNGSNLQTTAGVFTGYKVAIPKPDTIWEVQNTAGLTAFIPTLSQTGTGTVILDTSYKPVILNITYDALNNPNEQSKLQDAIVSYIWDYLHQYPIAKVVNATTSNIAYTSFEADGSGNWTIPSTLRDTSNRVTGNQSYVLSNGGISISGLTSSTTYIISYWSKAGEYTVTGSSSYITGKTINGWTYYEHTVTGVASLTVTGSGNIDELRLYPKTAQMTTYTYEPLTGMTSQCDLNNRITYYTYDITGRLLTVKDQDLNVLKKICYSYAGVASPCAVSPLYPNTVQSQAFTKNNCGTGYYGTTVTYTVPAGKYTSTSVAAANQLAQNDINANGQNYANANGSCTSGITVSANNLAGVSGFTVVYTNTSTGTQYSFSVPTAGGNLGSVPPGTYNIAFSKTGNTTYYSYGTCGLETTSGTSATLYNIAVSTSNSCNVVIIDSTE